MEEAPAGHAALPGREHGLTRVLAWLDARAAGDPAAPPVLLVHLADQTRQRASADLLRAAVADRSTGGAPPVLLVEDLHRRDRATLDLLVELRPGRRRSGHRRRDLLHRGGRGGWGGRG